MKIIQLLPELKVGGVERGTVDLSDHLIKLGHDSAVISAGGQLVNLLNDHGAKHYELPIAKKNIRALLQINNLIKIYSEFKPDIVHVRSRFPAWINYFALKNFQGRKPIVISTFHGLYSKPFYSKSMSYADEIIAISQTVKQYIQKNYYVDESNLHLIYRGCDLQEFNKSPLSQEWKEAWFEEFPETQNKIILNLPGRITSWKGIESFIDLFSNIDTSRFHGIIPGPVARNKRNYFTSLQKLIKQKNLTDHLTFCGARSDIAEVYKISDIVMNLSSKPEPFGRTIIEAAACGSHVMGWNRGGVKESINSINPVGLVDYGNVRMLAKQIDQVLATSPPEFIPKQFTKESLVNATMNVYDLALSKAS
jgi:glycosyltransferase involved in cell wall biosynthesis|tara:strand:+ start:801 stop:1895 length:1095 start_codon:yes stop_codon:yes gene_type:complete